MASEMDALSNGKEQPTGVFLLLLADRRGHQQERVLCSLNVAYAADVAIDGVPIRRGSVEVIVGNLEAIAEYLNEAEDPEWRLAGRI